MVKKKRASSRKKGHKVGESWTAMRKINGKRVRCKVTKTSKTKYSIHKIGAKTAKKKRRRG